MDPAKRKALGNFLRSRRDRVSPAAAGIAPGVRRRTPGLRREEVALLSGVSVTWYTWLEQGRDIHPSPEVLGSIARTLDLDHAETSYLLRLAGLPAPPSPSSGDTVPDHVGQFVHAQDPVPAVVADAIGDLLVWNATAEALFRYSAWPPAQRNFVWLMFADSALREWMVDWAGHAQRVLAELAATLADEPRVPGLIARLRRTFPEAAQWLDRREVRGRERADNEFDHPVVGRLCLRHMVFRSGDAEALQIVLLQPDLSTDTAQRLARLTTEPAPA